MRKGLREGHIGSEIGLDQSAKSDDDNQEACIADPQRFAASKAIVLYTCEHCGRQDIKSKSGYTLHIMRCAPTEPQTVNDGQYCLIGHTPLEHQRDDIYHLILEKYFDTESNLFVAVKEYFVTSGEAIAKIERLEKDARQLTNDAKKLNKLLREARADAKYLETGFDNQRQCLMRRKNPRKKKPVELVETTVSQ